MHIEPGVVDGAKIFLGYATAALVAGMALKSCGVALREHGGGPLSLLLRGGLATLLVFCFFEVLWHYPVGVSEVHLILGSTLYLLFGLAPTAIGLASGLLIQGLFCAPTDLPPYAINLTTLLAPLFVMHSLARRIVPARVAYIDLSYVQTLKLAAAYQGGIVVWVAFWAFYGQGFGAENCVNVASFGVAYMSILLAEPLIDLIVLAAAKSLHALRGSAAVEKRLYTAYAA